MRALGNPEDALGEVGDHRVRRHDRIERVAVPERHGRVADARAVAQHRDRRRGVDPAASALDELAHAGVARESRRQVADARVFRVVFQGRRAVVVREYRRGRVADDAERAARRALDHRGLAGLAVGDQEDVRRHRRVALDDGDRLVERTGTLEHGTGREHDGHARAVELAGAAAVHVDPDAFRVHPGDDAGHAGPADGHVRNFARRRHDRDDLVVVEPGVDVKIEVAADDRMAVRRTGSGGDERRACENRRVLERERDVVERVQVDEALVRREHERVGVGVPGTLAEDLGAPIGGKAAIEIAIARAHDRAHDGAERA